jgi:hypothetical protein
LSLAVILNPHIAGWTTEVAEATTKIIAANIKSFEFRRSINNVSKVNKQQANSFLGSIVWFSLYYRHSIVTWSYLESRIWYIHLVLLLSATLLVVGIERVVTGFTKSNRSSTQNPKEKKIINT